MAGHRSELFLLWLALIPLNLGGLLCLAIGLMITLPLSMIAMAAFYERLRSNAALYHQPPARKKGKRGRKAVRVEGVSEPDMRL